jgi:hypothetical protein
MAAMPTNKAQADIDALYRLPLAEFTAARNALAKTNGADIKKLQKPTVPAWAVNQLYWRKRSAFDALVKAAEAQRAAHKAVLAGRSADLREAGKTHDEAVETALESTLAILSGDGHPVTDATRQAILNTLRALPVDHHQAGRLTDTLQPGGFEMLAGLTIAGRAAAAKAAAKSAPKAPPGRGSKEAAASAASKREQADRQARIESAARKLKEAEQAARREEFEAARAARDAEKAERRVAEARDAFEAARETLEDAEADVPKAVRARDAAARRASQAAEAVLDARAALEKLRHG